MNKGRLVFAVITSISLPAIALAGLGACSSSTNAGSTSGDVPPVEAGRDVNVNMGDTSTADTFVPPPDDAGTGPECGTAAKLFPAKPDGGVFCPFSAPTGGKNIYCAETQECCQNPKGTGVSTCEMKAAACPMMTAVAWECEDKANCPTGQVCCAHSGTAGTAVTVGTDTCGAFLSKFSGTKCAATCAAEELVVCEQQSDCTTGTCTAVKPKGNDIGVCH